MADYIDIRGTAIEVLASDPTNPVEGSGFTLVYVDATQGWLLKDK